MIVKDSLVEKQFYILKNKALPNEQMTNETETNLSIEKFWKTAKLIHRHFPSSFFFTHLFAIFLTQECFSVIRIASSNIGMRKGN